MKDRNLGNVNGRETDLVVRDLEQTRVELIMGDSFRKEVGE